MKVFGYKILVPFLLVTLVNMAYSQRFDDIEVEPIRINEQLYVLKGAGGNIGLFVGKKDAFIIDSQYAEMSEKIKKAIMGITDYPLRYLINTHWHGDHTGGNENLAHGETKIIAHENVRKRLMEDQTMMAFGRTVKAAPQTKWPAITFKEEMSLHMDGEDVMIFHVHNAHTDGDAIVYFPKNNVVHMGDTYFRGNYPFYDVSSGGSLKGLITAVEKVLFISNEETVIIPGHGDLSNRKELQAYLSMLKTLFERMESLIAAELPLEEILASKPTQDLDAEWGGGFIKPDKIVDIMYTDFTRLK